MIGFSEATPYSEPMLAAITDANIDVVRSATKLLIELKLIEMLSDNTIFMNEICLEAGVGEPKEYVLRKVLECVFEEGRGRCCRSADSHRDNNMKCDKYTEN